MAKKWGIFNLSKDNLKRLYVDDGLSAKAISKLTKHDENTVRRYLRFYHISLRAHTEYVKGKQKPSLQVAGLDKEILDKLYNDEWLTTTQIANKFGCSKTAVINAIKRYDIPLHTSRIKGMDEVNLRKLYIDNRWSLERIAEHIGCHDEAVRKALMKYGIPVRTKAEAAKIKNILPDVQDKINRNLKSNKGVYGQDHPAWKGGRYIDRDGYVVIRVNGKPVLEHRHVNEPIFPALIAQACLPVAGVGESRV